LILPRCFDISLYAAAASIFLPLIFFFDADAYAAADIIEMAK